MELRNALHKLAPVISLVLFTLAILVVHHEIKVYHWQDIRRALQHFPALLMIACMGFTLLSYVALSFYDFDRFPLLGNPDVDQAPTGRIQGFGGAQFEQELIARGQHLSQFF